MATAKLTPVMQQYVDMKAENPDALLLFRLGDFYECFFDDARIVSNALSIVLTSRGTDGNGADIPMCGIPWHAADNYFGRLVKMGYLVALVEQMESPAAARAAGRKFITRKIIRVLTPGTLNDENLLSPKKSNFLVAIHGRDIAGCDISTGEFFIGVSDNLFDDLVRLNPAEVIYPEESAELPEIRRIRDFFKTNPVISKLYNRNDIADIAHNVFGQNLNPGNLAVGMLAGYLFNTQRDTKISFRAPYKFGAGRQLLIDSATWKSLEIDSPINDGGDCLLDVLDKTRTSAGARRLRAYLRTLSGDINEIGLRQNHIEHFMKNKSAISRLSQLLMRVPDVGRALSRLMSGRGTPRDLRGVSDFMLCLYDAKNLAGELDSDLGAKFEKINTHEDLTAELKFALNAELPTFFRDGDIIRTGFNPSLDNMRELSNGARTTIAALQSEYIASTGINTLKIKYNNILGYFIEVPSTRADAMMAPDSGFIHRQTMSGNMRFTTARLIDLDNDVRSAAERAAGIETEIINSFIEKIRTVSDDLLQSAELIADADVWCALADCASLYEWTRPQMTNDCALDIHGGRHPVIEYALRKRGDNFVKNDCDLMTRRIALLTGPNMAGKSTYLRQNALIIVMAHLGSFVPADAAKIGICDQLFSRVGASDNLAAGQSTFMVEMIETANILNRATVRSFVIFDEIGRGTATYDGMAIAQSVLEYMNDLNARTLFATHYHELTDLVNDSSDGLDNVQNLTLDVREHNDEIIFMYKVARGVANHSYGIHVAQMAGMPAVVVKRASDVLDGLENRTDVPPRTPVRHITSVIAPSDIEKIIDEPGVKPEEPKSDTPNKKTQLNLF